MHARPTINKPYSTDRAGRKMHAPRLALVVFLAVLLAACTATPGLRIVKGAMMTMDLEMPSSYVISSEFSLGDKYALSGSIDKLAAVWDIKTSRKVATIEAGTGGSGTYAGGPEQQPGGGPEPRREGDHRGAGPLFEGQDNGPVKGVGPCPDACHHPFWK